MPDFSQRSYQQELLDRDDIPFADIKRNMQELEIINDYLGGHRITTAGCKKIFTGVNNQHNANQPLVICEIGCGGGDNLKAIEKYCASKKIPVRFIGIDINDDCIRYAKENCNKLEVEWIISDYKLTILPVKPDIIFSSLFCHHFKDDELVYQLQWMKENAAMGFFINDLHRHPLAYHSIKLLTRLFSKSYLVKNDAPLSVLRGFSGREWKQLLNNAGIDKFELKWKWAFRWLIIVSRQS
jgi:2-polyprenyl-3-methyl-5-hydroxy-6-metoxy-1,4-benzoquinol methylase